jgi:hypothetical protein
VVGDGNVVSIVASGDQLVAVVADRRRTRRYSLGSPIEVAKFGERAANALRGLSASTDSPAVAAARERAFAAAVEVLDATVLRPLRLDGSHIVLIVPAEMHALPWAAMASLQDRSFTLAPSVRWWIDAATQPHVRPRSTLVVAGPRLAEAKAEALGVAACHRRSTLMTDDIATVANVSVAMGTHDAVHFVAHGTFRHDNPLWSAIELADGQLTVYELERLGRVPSTVVLATCESGMGGVRGGSQLHGLAATLLTMGARTIVAAIGALPDSAETRRTMIDLHRDLAGGTTASASLARQRTTTDGFSLAAASLVTLGVG